MWMSNALRVIKGLGEAAGAWRSAPPELWRETSSSSSSSRLSSFHQSAINISVPHPAEDKKCLFQAQSVPANMQSEFLRSSSSIRFIASSLGVRHFHRQILRQRELRPLLVTRNKTWIASRGKIPRYNPILFLAVTCAGGERFSTVLLLGLLKVFPYQDNL